MGSGTKLNAVFYANSYHPIQAGSINGTDILPHDNAIYRAQLCSSAGLYDPFGDPKVVGGPYCTLFVGILSRFTKEDSLRKAMSKYGGVKILHLVRHIGISPSSTRKVDSQKIGWGLGGKKESGQLRFGGRERPFKAPLRPIPLDDLKRLGVPPPPEGREIHVTLSDSISPKKKTELCR